MLSLSAGLMKDPGVPPPCQRVYDLAPLLKNFPFLQAQKISFPLNAGFPIHSGLGGVGAGTAQWLTDDLCGGGS